MEKIFFLNVEENRCPLIFFIGHRLSDSYIYDIRDRIRIREKIREEIKKYSKNEP